MHNDTRRSGHLFALAAVVAVCGANESQATPLPIDRIAPQSLQRTAQIKPSSTGMAWRAAGAGRNIAVDELMNRHDRRSSTASPTRLVRLRPSSRSVTAERLLADVGVFDATPDGRPISDVYDFTGVNSGMPGPITPREMTRRLRSPDVGTQQRTTEVSRAARPHEAQQWHRPEPPAHQPDRPGQSSEALDLGIKTLDYMVMATRIIVETVSRFLKNVQ